MSADGGNSEPSKRNGELARRSGELARRNAGLAQRKAELAELAGRKAELAERMAPVCVDAVDALEVAAALEADGITDAAATRRYGAADVFHLAEQLHRDHPARPTPAAPGVNPWQVRPARHLLRGVLFTLPAICYLAASGLVTGPVAGTVVVVSLLLSWALSQAMAYLGYVRHGAGDPAAAARVLRGTLLRWGIVAIVISIGLAVVLEVPAAVGILAVGQVGYLLAATVVLVQGAERALLLALLPGVAGNIAAAVVADGSWRVVAAWCSALTVLATLALALKVTAGVRGGVAPSIAELAAATPQGLYGLFAGGLVVFAPAAQALVGGVAAGGAAAVAKVAVLPLTASMGVAEWLLYRYRAAIHRVLQRALTLSQFRRLAAGVLLGAVGTYLAVLAVGSGIVGGLTALTNGVTPPVLPLAGVTALGGALFVTLLLLACGARVVAVACCGSALTVAVLVTVAGAYTGLPVDLIAVQFATAAGLFALLLIYALRALSRVTRHR